MKTIEMMRIISENVRYYRMNNKSTGYITQEQLSRISGISYSIIRKIERNKNEEVISLLTLNRLADTLNIPLYKFFIKER